MIIKNKFFALFIFTSFTSFAQQLFYPLDHDENAFVEMYFNDTKSNSHTSIKPFFYEDIKREIDVDSIEYTTTRTNRLSIQSKWAWAKFLRWSENKLMDEDLVSLNSGGLKLRANLLLGLQAGTELFQDKNFWTNTRGYWLSGQVGTKVFFESSFYENQAKLLPYINSNATANFVMPGQGRYKIFKENIGADWAFASGAVGYRANKYFTAFLGHGKNFFGDGYRSLLLSDNSFNYPYFKFETTVWNIKYVNLWAQLNHIGFQDAADRNWSQKYLSVHYLSWNITKRLNLSLYESISWLKADKGFDWQYANPVIFMRPVEWQNGSADNVLMGSSFKYKMNKNFLVYGQAVLDDLNFSELKKSNGYWGNKFGGQLGIKAFRILNIHGLSAQAEYNAVRPFTYTHFDSTNAHGHMNEPLAHPLGANFQEAVAFLRYKFNRQKLTLKLVWSEIGKDTLGINHGGNVFYGYNTNRVDINGDGGLSGYSIGQGDLNKLNFLDFRYAFLVNPRARLYFEIGLKNRILSRQSLPKDQMRFLYLGVRTTLNNFYYDSF